MNSQTIRPIYEAIDYRQYDLALNLINKSLKTRDSHLLKSLKALALVRQGNFELGLQVALEVVALRPMDAPTLQALSMSFTDLGEFEKIATIYETAYGGNLADEENGAHWFMALVRIHDFKKMQVAAMKLFKQFGDPKYYFWAVQALFLQSRDSPTKGLLLTLAERLIDKAVADHTLTSCEALRLSVDVLVASGKVGKAIGFLGSDLKDTFKVQRDLDQELAVLLRKDSQWSRLQTLSQESLRQYPDDWDYMLGYLDSTLELKSENSFEKAVDFLRELQTLVSVDKHLKRGQEDCQKALVKYVDQFGKATCCFEDVKAYAISLKNPGELLKSIQGLPVDPSQLDGLRKLVTCKKLLQLLSTPSHDEMDAEIVALMNLYHASSGLSQGLDERELHYGDDLILLATHYRLTQYLNSKKASHLYQALYLLELGLSKSKFSHQLKLLAIRVYIEAGIYQRPLDLASSLQIRQMQSDSLSYLFTDDLECFGNLDVAENQFATASRIYQANEDETPEMILQAFKFGTFSKILEFYRFHDRLFNSIQRVKFYLQRHWNWTMQSSFEKLVKWDVADLIKSTLELNVLHDNRDVKVMSHFSKDPKPVRDILRGNELVSSTKEWIQLQGVILNLMDHLIHVQKHEQVKVASTQIVDLVGSSSLGPIQKASIHILTTFASMLPFESTSLTLLKPLEDALQVLIMLIGELDYSVSSTQLSFEKAGSTYSALQGLFYIKTCLGVLNVLQIKPDSLTSSFKSCGQDLMKKFKVAIMDIQTPPVSWSTLLFDDVKDSNVKVVVNNVTKSWRTSFACYSDILKTILQ